MKPDRDTARWVAETMQAHPGFGPIESVTERNGEHSIPWPPEWVAKLNERMKEGDNA